MQRYKPTESGDVSKEALPLFCVQEEIQMQQKEKGRWRSIPIPDRCVGCPYGRVGFICHDSRGDACMRTDVEELSGQCPRNNNDPIQNGGDKK